MELQLKYRNYRKYRKTEHRAIQMDSEETHRIHCVELLLLNDAAVIKRDREVRVVKHMRHSSEPNLKEA